MRKLCECVPTLAAVRDEVDGGDGHDDDAHDEVRHGQAHDEHVGHRLQPLLGPALRMLNRLKNLN